MTVKNINAKPDRRAPAEFELLLCEWVRWKMDGCSGALGFPSEASFSRNMGGGQRDYVPDVDFSARCSDVQAALDRVGGISKNIVETAYLWRSSESIKRLAERYHVSRATLYRWLDDARYCVWREYQAIVCSKAASACLTNS